jgi:hypothetical protein
LPRDCGAAKSFVAISDGPSTQEYDPAELRSCSASIIGYGRIARTIPPRYYLLADPGFAEVLGHLPATHVLISKDGPYGGPRGPMYWDQLPKDRGHTYQWAPAHCAHHPVLNALELGAEQVFLLGHDGYHGHDGRLRSVSHAEQLVDTSIISKDKYATISLPKRHANFWVTDVNRISWDMTIKATHRVQGVDPQIFNLSFGSRHRAVWDVHPDVLRQPFGPIDRRGPAMLIHIIETDDEVPRLEIKHSVPRARWGPLHVGNHAEFINRLRSIEPHLAIYVRTHTSVEELAELLVEDVQVGDIETEFAPQLHGELFHFRLPPINDRWGAPS